MFFCLFLVGAFLWGTFNLFGVIRLAREKVEINAFLRENLPEKQIEELITKPDKLKKLETEAFRNARKYSLANLQDYFEKNVLTWLKNN